MISETRSRTWAAVSGFHWLTIQSSFYLDHSVRLTAIIRTAHNAVQIRVTSRKDSALANARIFPRRDGACLNSQAHPAGQQRVANFLRAPGNPSYHARLLPALRRPRWRLS